MCVIVIQIIRDLTSLLQQFTGDPGLPSPRRLYRHAWSEDPFALSSLTFPTMATELTDFTALSSPLPSLADPRLLFAGEATSKESFGTLHGARLSGIREADKVLDRMEQMDRMAMEMGRITVLEVNGRISDGEEEKQKFGGGGKNQFKMLRFKD